MRATRRVSAAVAALGATARERCAHGAAVARGLAYCDPYEGDD